MAATGEDYDPTLASYNDELELAETMIPLVGGLYRKGNIISNVYGVNIVNLSTLGILKVFDEANKNLKTAVTVAQAFPIIEAAADMGLAPCRLDVGKLANMYEAAKAKAGAGEDFSHRDFLYSVFSELEPPLLGIGKAKLLDHPQDVVLYGFGRIGRLVARILISKAGGGMKLRLRCIVVRPPGKKLAHDLATRASLLALDSTHGPFDGTVDIDEETHSIVANGNVIRLVYASSPSEVDYTQYGVEDGILIDNTGKWRNRAGLQAHADCPGIAKVMLTAPADDIPNVVMGVNNDRLEESNILATASCTTNAVVPILNALNNKYGVEAVHVETVHSYTNDQNLLDNYHKKNRRGRAAAINMVLTETGAATAVVDSLPFLDGKITGNAIRVPTHDVSLAILVIDLETEDITAEEINEYLRQQSIEGPLHRQLGFSASPEVVSSDFVSSSDSTVIVDSQATLVHKKRVNIYAWYDNEYGFSHQVVRMAQALGGVTFRVIPSPATSYE